MIGTGILKGMAVTARNFVGSYFEKERLTTVQYPGGAQSASGKLSEFSVPDLRRHDAPQRACAAWPARFARRNVRRSASTSLRATDKKPDYMGKPQFYPKMFDIDISVCMSCQICVEVCPFEAIKMDKEFELSRRERFDALLMRKERTFQIERVLSQDPSRRSRGG